MRRNIEFLIRDYYAEKLEYIDKKISLIETEHEFPGGRIDIYAKNKYTQRPIAIEIKALKYNTKNTAMQLLNYINYVKEKKGKVYFVSPKVNQGLLNILKEYYDKNLVQFYEYTYKNEQFTAKKVKEKDLDDTRNIKFMDEIIKEKNITKKYAIKKMTSAGIDMLIGANFKNAQYKLIRKIVKNMIGY